MNLDDFKSNWQNQKSPEQLKEEKANELLTQLKSFDKKLNRQNKFISFAFGITALFLLLILFTFTEFGGAFYIALLGTILLMAVSLWLLWKRKILSDQQDLSLESIQFVDGRIAQLEYNKKISRIYMPIYAILLTSLFMIYIGEVGQLMERKYQLMVYAMTLAYIVFVMFFGMRKQFRKEREELDPMLEELREVKRSWEAK